LDIQDPIIPPSSADALTEAPSYGEPGSPAFDHLDPGFVPAISGYAILSRIGQGATSTVWRARHLETNRVVALKLINTSSMEPQVRQRFEREVEIAARMEHPHIARLYGSGIQAGYFFYAMELVDGQTLDRFVRDRKLTRRQVLEITSLICDAVQYTHQRGVIHRDLKPANILVSPDGQPHILDFGLAKETELAKELNRPMETVSGDGIVAGTLGFMSPQQAAGQSDLVDTRSDIYSLGAILYYLLAGRTPHDLSGSRIRAVQRTAEEEVIRPRLADPTLDGEIEAILLKALAREPEARYSSAGAMAEDLRRYLHGEPLSARPPTLIYFLRKRLRRYRTPLLIAAAIGFFLLAMAIYSVVRINAAWHVAEANEQKAQQEARAASINAQAAAQARSLAEARLVAGLTRAGDGYAASQRYATARKSYLEAGEAAGSAIPPPLAISSGLLLTYIEGSPPLLGPDGDNPFVGGLAGHAGNIHCVSISPDGKVIATGGDDGTVRLWDIVAGLEIGRLDEPQCRVACIAFSPNGQTLLTGCEESQVALWDVKTRSKLKSFAGHGARVASIAFFFDGRRFITAGGDKTIRVFDVDAERRIEDMGAGAMLTGIAVSPDGTTVLACSEDKVVGLWDLKRKMLTRNLNAKGQHRSLCVALSHDGKIAAAGDDHGFIHLWKRETEEEIATLQGSLAPVFSIAFSPDDKTLVAGASDRQVRVWDVAGAKQLYVFTGHGGPVHGVAVTPDGTRCVSVGDDGTARLWLLSSDSERQFFGRRENAATDISVSLDGRTAWTAGGFVPVQQWDIDGGTALRELPRESRFATCMAQSADGRFLITGHGRGRVSLWDTTSGASLQNLEGHTQQVTSVAISRTGEMAVSAADDATIRVWDLRGGKELRRFDPSPVALALALSPDGKTALSAGGDYVLRQWDVTTGKQKLALPGHLRAVNSLAFSSDGSKAVSGSNDTTVRLWDLRTGRESRILATHATAVRAVKFSPDDQLIASASFDGDMSVWRAATGELVRTFSGRSIAVHRLDFAPDGNSIISAGQDGALCKWDFSRPALYRRFEKRLPAAREALAKDPQNADGLLAFGEWYAFRGDWELAATLLGRARAKGASVSLLLLARCLRRSGDPDAAIPEFHAAIQAGEAPGSFLKLCIDEARRQGSRRK
jgi:WD40 repeat protein/tRNA A-37 threonylcarbamoyl transferase component Bud32